MKFIVPLFIILDLSISCTNVQQEPLGPYRTNNDSIVREIPEWYRNSGFSKKFHKKIFQLLKLRSLENGHDNLNIRIWTDCEQANRSLPTELIMLERTQSGWNAVSYLFTIKAIGPFDEGTNSDYEIRDVRIENKSPKSGWKKFSNDLMNSGIINLHEGAEFYDYEGSESSQTVWVEIGTPKKYRIYHFEMIPIKRPEESGELLKLIQNEFDIIWPCKYTIDN